MTRFKILLILFVLNKCIKTSAQSIQVCEDCPNYKNFLSCDPVTCDWLLANRVWAGSTTDNGSLLLAYCAPGNCFYNVTGYKLRIPQTMTHVLNEILCNQTNRKGILCSQCQPGYGHAINTDTFDCVTCDPQSSRVNWLYYILSVYVPLLVVFLFIILFNVNLTSGPANTFIIYAQVITTTFSLLNTNGISILSPTFRNSTKPFISSYEVPYNVLNLDIFSNLLPSFCLDDKLGALDIIALKYLEALFPVVIIMVIIILIKCQRHLKVNVNHGSFCCRRWKGISLPHAFAAFVLLSYNRLCQITVYLLVTIPMWDSTLDTVEYRVYFSGNYLSSDYSYTTRYKLPAYLFLFVLVILPILLLHYPLVWVEKGVAKVSFLRKVYPAARIAILLDTFQGCFRNNRRYFAGLYLVFRLLLFFAYSQVIPLQFLLQLIIVILYILFIAFWKPYKNVFFNYVDMCIFADMMFISCLSWYVEDPTADNYVVQICLVTASILVYLPMLYMVAYLIWYYTSCYHGKIKNLFTVWCKKTFKIESNTEYNSIVIGADSYSPQHNNDDFYDIIDFNAQQRKDTEKDIS